MKQNIDKLRELVDDNNNHVTFNGWPIIIVMDTFIELQREGYEEQVSFDDDNFGWHRVKVYKLEVSPFVT